MITNSITVRLNNDVVHSFDDCSMVIDNCDESIRIERKSETVAHYKRSEWLSIVQALS